MQLSFSSITLDYYPFHRAGKHLIWFDGNLKKKKKPLEFTTRVRVAIFWDCTSMLIL